MRRILFFSTLLLILHSGIFAQSKNEKKWIKKQYRALSIDEKIAQLMVLRAHSNWEPKKIDSLSALIKTYNVGGLCFFQGGPIRQAQQTNLYQSIAKTPLLIAIDAEWGIGMRLDSVEQFPRQLSLGAISSSDLIYQMGAAIAAQCKRLGIQANYAPDVDINNNAQNPVINDRSFGQDKNKVIQHGIAYMRGLQENGIMAAAKHFPGHGDVTVDSHKDIPVINKSRAALDSMELLPFKALINAGIASVMVAHLSVPAIDARENRPSSLSDKTVTGLLKNELGFTGISITDALDMQAISKYYPEGEANVEAILAGHDMLCLPGEIGQSIKAIKQAIKDKRIKRSAINARVKKILGAKYKYGLHQNQWIDTLNLLNDLNKSVGTIKAEMTAQSLTYVNAHKLPAIGKKTAYLALNTNEPNTLTRSLASKGVRIFYLGANDTIQLEGILTNLRQFDEVLVGLHNYNRKPAKQFEISPFLINFLNSPGHENWIHLIFGNPYAVGYFKNIQNILFAYEDNNDSQNSAMNWLEGKVQATGSLPVTIAEGLEVGKSAVVEIKKKNQSFSNELSNTETTIDVQKLAVIDSIAIDAIEKKAIPGCQILVAKNNQIVFNKAFGSIAGMGSEKVTLSTVYDLASVTKTSATTVAIMKLMEEGKIALDKTIGDYLPWVRDSLKSSITLRNLLLHEAGLYPYIKFYESLLKPNGEFKDGLVSAVQDATHSRFISPGKYLLNSWQDSIQQKIMESPLSKSGSYLYSDNDFIFLGQIVEQLTGMNLHEYTTSQFYGPLGMSSTGFLPLQKTGLENIAATEIDAYYRNTLIHGAVHDEGASVMGGIAGHAGLFSNASDLAKLYLMLLNNGYWDNKKYFNKETIQAFTSYQSAISRRGLGFDKPAKDNLTSKDPYPSYSAPASTFGHTGFTGTCVWADPDNKLLYIFLSNRVYPTRNNKVFAELNIRSKIQEVIYASLNEE